MRTETLPSDEEISPFCFISVCLPIRVYNLPVLDKFSNGYILQYFYLLYILRLLTQKTLKASVHRCFFKVGVLKNFGRFTGKHLFSSLLLIMLELQLCLKAASAQVFSCEIYEIFKNSLFYRTPSVAAFKTPFKRVKDVCLSNNIEVLYVTIGNPALTLVIFNWRTFSRRVTARWWRQWAKNQVLTNQNWRNRC